jgi:hypothetical protein
MVTDIPVASPDTKRPLVAWLREVFRPEADAGYFDRLAGRIEASAPVACPSCA